MAKDARSVDLLTVLEIEKAKNVLIQQSQEQSFPAEVAALRKGGSISSKSNLGSLTPFIDEDGIIRAGGRLDKAEIPFIARLEVYPGADGVVRLTDVKTKFGQLKRPVTKLALLEECSSV